MGWESSDVVRFDLGPLLQGQMWNINLVSAYTVEPLLSDLLLSEFSIIRPQTHSLNSL